jgi:hypothetical protein
MYKNVVKVLTVFSLTSLIVVTYSFRMQYSLWYDEAAVVENATNLSFSELNEGLNWLQTIPVAYFALAKFLLQYSYGVEVLRMISTGAFIFGTLVIVRNLLPIETKFIYRFVCAFAILGNPISITYATMVKPYALEFLLGVLALYYFKTVNSRALILLGIAGPLISNSTSLMYAAIVVVAFLKNKQFKSALYMAAANFLATLISLYFTAAGTREMMKSVWFGDIEGIGIQSFKSAIGNLGWLPVSGLGLIPENGSSTLYLYSSLAILGLILAFACWPRTDYVKILCIAIGLTVVGQTLLLIPAAGRLLLGISGLIWMLTIYRASKLRGKLGIGVSSAIFLVISTSSIMSNVWLNPVASSHVKEIIEPISSQRTFGQIYANLWAGPGTRYYLVDSKDKLSSNLIWVDDKANLSACWPVVLRKNDLISLDFISESVLRQMDSTGSLKPLSVSFNSGLFKVTKDFSVPGLEKPELQLSCMYSWSNPQFPMRDTSDVR